MQSAKSLSLTERIEKISLKVTDMAGSSATIILACLIVIIWAATGPVFKFSNTWLIFIDSFTAVITFIMVFLIQRSQNKDSLIVQIKLNEILASTQLASNRIISIEDMTEQELKVVNDYYIKLSEKTIGINDKGKMSNDNLIEELKTVVLNKEKQPDNKIRESIIPKGIEID